MPDRRCLPGFGKARDYMNNVCQRNDVSVNFSVLYLQGPISDSARGLHGIERNTH